MKNDMNRRFRTRVITNIFYSAVVTVLIEVFLVTNVSLIATYMAMRESIISLYRFSSPLTWWLF